MSGYICAPAGARFIFSRFGHPHFYGIVPTFQPAGFGKVYAAYGGIFIVLSLLWGWLIDGTVPDLYDRLGGFVCLMGVWIIMYAPR